MKNHSTGRAYVVTPNSDQSDAWRASTDGDSPYSVLLRDQILYFMETKWVKPTPISANVDRIEGRDVSIVTTRVQGMRVDFALDRITSLPIRITYHNPPITRSSGITLFFVDILEYAEVDGIKIPIKFKPENGVVTTSEVKVNVDYDGSIFERVTPIESGPEAWRKK
jgi:hypothetical protein